MFVAFNANTIVISTFDKLDLQQEYIFINYNPT